MTKSGGSTDTATRQGTYYFDAYALTNTSVPVAATLTASDGTNSASIPAYLAETAEAFAYDLDGNLLSDGRWDYTYDAENRIKRMQSTSAAATALSGDARRIDFVYDYLGRRVQKTVHSGASSYTTLVSDEKFVWNGWLLIAKLTVSGSTNTLASSYYWGTDLSGNTQGAGGVGGLLMTQENSNAYLPLYDAMGNVHAMLKASDGSLAAAYEYDAFGRTLRADGADATFAAANPWRFSTKYTDVETGLVDYGHRYYSPSLGRFINRDPIGESGGLNLYAFVGNNGANRWDYLGLCGGAGEPPCQLPPMTVGPGDPAGYTPGVFDYQDFYNPNYRSPPFVNIAPIQPPAIGNPALNKTDKPKPDLRKIECEQARRLAASVKQNVNDHTAAIGQGLTFGQFVNFQSERTTLGFVGSGATQEAQNALSPALVGVINKVEQDLALTIYRYGAVALGSGWATLGNLATLRWAWNTNGANADFTLPIIAAEKFTHEALANELDEFISACDKEGK